MNKLFILTASAILVLGLVSGLRVPTQSRDSQPITYDVMADDEGEEGDEGLPSVSGDFGKIDDSNNDNDNQGDHGDQDQFDDNWDDESDDDLDNKPMNKLAKSCFSKILGPSLKCIAKSMTKWQVTAAEIRLVHNTRPVCCFIWQMTGCMTSMSKDHCTKNERSAFLMHMSLETERRNLKNCTQYPYHSNDCAAGPAPPGLQNAGNYYSDVMYRRNNRLANDNELKPDLKESDLPADEPAQEPRVVVEEDPDDDDEGQERENDQEVEVVEIDDGKDQANALDEFALTQRLLDRVDRITVNQYIIDLHPVGKKHGGHHKHHGHKHHHDNPRNAVYKHEKHQPSVIIEQVNDDDLDEPMQSV